MTCSARSPTRLGSAPTPGLQYDTTINRWHTAPNTGRINGSNPCSEYVHLDNSACNLASMNLLTFLDENDEFDVDGFKAAVSVVFTGQEIIVGNADYPTERIGETTRAFRQLGIGYANLGALLMAQGLPYDSDAGRAWAAAITALLTGHAYATSARTAARMGPFAGYHENARADAQRPAHAPGRGGPHRRGRRPARAALRRPGVLGPGRRAGRGVRRAQLAGVGARTDRHHRPADGLRHHRRRARPRAGQDEEAGGRRHDVDRQPDRAPRPGQARLRPEQIEDIVDLRQRAHVDPGRAAPRPGAPAGVRLLHGRQHHPLLGPHPHDGGGAALHQRRHLQDGQHARGRDGRGRRAAAHRRLAPRAQGGRHLPGQLQGGPAAVDDEEGGCAGRGRGWRHAPAGSEAEAKDREIAARIAELEAALEHERLRAESPLVVGAVRERLPRKRNSKTFSFRVADCEGYVTVGEYEDGRPGEVFIKVSKQGSTLAGIMDAFSISISLGLQHQVPLATFVRKFANMKFEPAGITDDPELRIATSLIDYIFRRLALDYLSSEDRTELGILSTLERTQPTLPGVEEMATPSLGLVDDG